MSFTIPTFNLTCNVWTHATPPPAARRAVFACNLAMGRRHLLTGASSFEMSLLLPIGTDIRSALTASGSDVVEVPAGSGRYYNVIGVDDSGKGFPNEHRVAVLQGAILPGGIVWPTPIP